MKRFIKYLLLLVMLIISLNCFKVFGESGDSVILPSEEEVFNYTNSDTYDGLHSIEDYLKNDYGKNVKLVSNEKRQILSVYIYDDDEIVKIIPKEFFMTECNELYIGKEYGFFIKTQKNMYTYDDETKLEFDHKPIVPKYYTSNVVVFNIETILTKSETSTLYNQFEYNLNILFNNVYYLVDFEEFSSMDLMVTDNLLGMHYNYSSKEKIVTPLLDNHPTYFDYDNNLCFKNFSCYSSIIPLDYLNSNDKDYDITKDNNASFSSFYYEMHTEKLVKKCELTTDCETKELNIIGKIFKGASLVAAGVSAFSPEPMSKIISTGLSYCFKGVSAGISLYDSNRKVPAILDVSTTTMLFGSAHDRQINEIDYLRELYSCVSNTNHYLYADGNNNSSIRFVYGLDNVYKEKMF